MDKRILSEIGLQSAASSGGEVNKMVNSCQVWGCRFVLAACAMSGVIVFFGDRALAQVTPDGTLGTQVTPNGNAFDITGGTPAGANLFHSFGSFSVPDGGLANFLNDVNVINIFGRVTGGNPSDIQGIIQAQGTANLFLINPSGIIFGPNARLDIGGSFVGTTASGVRFPNGGEFSMNSAVTPNDSLLSVNPSALFFNETPAGVRVSQSTLEVDPGQNLFLVGGDVTLNGGTMRAPGGRIELGGLAEAGEVQIEDFTNDASNPNLSFPLVGLIFPDDVERADVSLTSGAIVDVTGENGGNIAVTAQNISLSGQSNICAGIGSNPDCGGVSGQAAGTNTSRAGNIILDATEDVELSGLSRIANNVNDNATGNNDFDILTAVDLAIATGDPSYIFGSVFITTESLSITEGASVSTSTFGTGNAGLVYVDAEDSVSIAGYQEIPGSSLLSRSRLASAVGSSDAVGNAGGIFILTGSLSLTDYSLLNSSTSGQGNAGAIVVEADGAVSIINSDIFNNVESGGVGNAGLIDISAESLSLIDGAQLQTLVREASDDGTLAAGSGNAGDIEINVRDTVTVRGENNAGFPSAIFSSIGPGVSGNAGNIQISTGSLSLSDGGYIDTSLGGFGTAGSIFIAATDSISLANEAEIRTVIEQDAQESRGSSSPFAGNIIGVLLGNGGDVTGTILISTGSLSLTNGSRLETSTQGNGNAGGVVVFARDEVSLKGGVISSAVGEQATGNAGAILMDVGSLSIESTSTNAAGLTTETDGQGDAGGILVLADKDISIRGEENGNEVGISTEVAEGSAGTGGAIILGARSLFLRDGAKVSVDNQGSGIAGDIEITMREDIILRDEGIIKAISNSGEGGNIFLTSGDFLVLVSDSQVSTEAGRRMAAGKGGNVDVDTRYIIAAPFNDNNISAQAGQEGGSINFETNRLYDIEERINIPVSNDIDASADVGIDGIVTSTVLNVDPTQGLANLPTNPIDPTSLIGETCSPVGSIEEREKNTYTVTERGGLPPDPNAAFPGEAIINDLETPAEGETTPDDPNSTNITTPTPVAAATPQEPELVEAQGWVYGENGNIIFTAQAPVVTPNNSVRTPASTCHASTSPQ